jgi:hypothetical protein
LPELILTGRYNIDLSGREDASPHHPHDHGLATS